MTHKEEENEGIEIKANLRALLSLAKPYWPFLVILVFLLILIEVGSLGEKLILKHLIDNSNNYVSNVLTREQFVAILLMLAGIFLGIIVIRTVAIWFRSFLSNRVDTGMELDVKKKFFGHVLSLSANFHANHKTGSLIARLVRGGKAVEPMMDFFIMNLIPFISQLLLSVGSIMVFDFATAVVMIVSAIIFITFSFLIMRKQQFAAIAANNAEDLEKGALSDILTNVESVKYFGKEDYTKSRYNKLAELAKIAKLKQLTYYNLLESGQIFFMGVGLLLAFYFPIRSFLDGQISIGTLTFIYATYGSVMYPLFYFVYGIRQFYGSMADFQSLRKYDKVVNDIVDAPHAKTANITKGAIEFKNIGFSYQSKKVFDDLSLKIKPNEKIALVGYSGSGKTTLVKLLYRLYDVDKGDITIDGHSVKEYKQESLRSELSIVPQECILFDDTIYNNILFSRPTASKAEVLKAIKLARLDSLVEGLPKGVDTFVGERGIKLSGGEKQRVSIARAILADKKVLILDEATSALDSKTESEIQEGLKNLLAGRTSIIIAHRLSTIMNSDRIIVMNKGEVVQEGTHEKLIKQPGKYASLWKLQKGGYIK